jgi:hypothetical protein
MKNTPTRGIGARNPETDLRADIDQHEYHHDVSVSFAGK